MSGSRNRRRHPAHAEPARTTGRGQILAISFALIALTLIAYGRVGHHQFLLFDDASYVTENGAVRSGLTATGVRWAFTTPYAGNWHPLTWLSHMTDVRLFGLEPGWHHFSSLFLHVLTTLLLFRLFVRMTGSVGASGFVAALFAWHPLHVESVAWIAERKDVLSTLWWVVTVSAYVTYVRQPGTWRYGLMLIAFGLALLSKPMVVTLPFVLLLLDVWPLGRWNGQSAAGDRQDTASGGPSASDRRSMTSDGRSMVVLIKEKAPLFAMAAALAIITYVVQRQAGAVRSLDVLPLSARLANVPVAYVTYLFNTIWPVNLAVLYPYPASLPLWQSAGAAVILIALSAIVWRMRVTRPYALVGWCWFLGTLVPAIGIVQVGSQPHADRYMYVPAIGLFVIIVFAARELLTARPGWSRPIVAAGIALTLAMGALTYRQVGTWKDSITLWTHAVAATTDNYLAHTNLGFSLAESGQRTAALAAYEEALRLNPSYANAHNYLGVLRADMGDHERAAAEFQEAIRLTPRFAQAHNNLGLARAAQDRVDDAVTEFTEALRIDPGFVPARNNLAIAYIRQDRFDRAIPELEAVIRQRPGSPESELNLASALAQSGKTRESLPHFESAARLGGDPIRVHYAWGEVLMDLGEASQATTQFAAVLQVNPTFAPAVHNLGRSLALSGRLNEGLQALQMAVQLEPDNADFHHDFGAALARRGMIAEAIAEMRAALQRDPSHVEAQEALRLLIRK